MISQGEIWWVDFPDPTDSGPGFRRPGLVVQGDHFNRSALGTTIVVTLTSQLRHRDVPGNAFLPSSVSGLPKDSLALCHQLTTLDKNLLDQLVGRIPDRYLIEILNAVDLVFGRA